MTPAPTVVILDQTLPSATIGIAYSTTMTASGGSGPYTWVLTGSLPVGVTFAAGMISGTADGSPATTSFTVTARDATGLSGSQVFSLSSVAASGGAVSNSGFIA